MRSRQARAGDLLELHASLRDIDPPVWRRIRVPAEATFGVLHDVLQVVFDWDNDHLHDFEVGHIHFSAGDDDILVIDEDVAPLGAVLRTGSKLLYRYDYGDDWQHDIKVERIVDGRAGPELVCLDGKRAAPPEDCGGPGGYEDKLAALADPEDDEHDAAEEWFGRGFDPERFDLAGVNKRLAALAKRIFSA